jgi:uncharacterized protein (DUF1810 family)
MSPATLDRFVAAQDRDGAFEGALAELLAGQKRGHWIWFVFPQLRGLGVSPMAEHYGLDGLEEAEAYLRHTALRSRLRAATVAVHGHLTGRGASVRHLMGAHVDALKLVSSLTLFERVARSVRQTGPSPELAELATMAAEILEVAARQGYPRCRFTLDALG